MKPIGNFNLLQQWLTRPIVLGDYSKSIPRWAWLTMMFWRFAIVLAALPMFTHPSPQAAATGSEICQHCSSEIADRSASASR
ncbi:hypothetical protein IFO70_02090 [Phormidium tenue FACHB-886]|nr:hypothetical protein [Phormidium tenue FACHB-886]